MPTGGHVRYKLSGAIPRNDWREPLTQRSFVEWTYQEPCTTLDGLSPIAVAREGSRLAAAISGDELRLGTSIEIFLAKIVCGRYIDFTCLIRYFDVQIALTHREDSSKARHPFDCRRSRLRRGGPSKS
jgi:hypothetical protein